MLYFDRYLNTIDNARRREIRAFCFKRVKKIFQYARAIYFLLIQYRSVRWCVTLPLVEFPRRVFFTPIIRIVFML